MDPIARRVRAVKCLLCLLPCRNAVATPCCFRSFCKECILCELPFIEFTCPLCGNPCVPERLKENKALTRVANEIRKILKK